MRKLRFRYQSRVSVTHGDQNRNYCTDIQTHLNIMASAPKKERIYSSLQKNTVSEWPLYWLFYKERKYNHYHWPYTQLTRWTINPDTKMKMKTKGGKKLLEEIKTKNTKKRKKKEILSWAFSLPRIQSYLDRELFGVCMWMDRIHLLDHWNSISKFLEGPLLLSGRRVYSPATAPSTTTRSIWIVTLPNLLCCHDQGEEVRERFLSITVFANST